MTTPTHSAAPDKDWARRDRQALREPSLHRVFALALIKTAKPERANFVVLRGTSWFHEFGTLRGLATESSRRYSLHNDVMETGMARWRKKLPFRELTIPFKMAAGKLRNFRRRITPFRELDLPHGSLRIHGGVPVVHVKGSHREMGRALGTLVGVQAAETYYNYMAVFAPDFEGDLKLARGMEPFMPAWFLEEMKGFSETCELSYEQILVGQCFLDIHKVAACSTVAAHDSATVDGETLIGRNLDFPSLDIANEANIVVTYEPLEPEASAKGPGAEVGPRRYTGVTWPGFLGVLTGMNDAGLALSMMLVYGQMRHEHLKGQPFPLVFRRLLHECADVDKASRLLNDRPYCTATNVIVADKGRHAARFQLHPREVVSDFTSTDSPVIACTNHYFDRGIRTFAFTWFSSILRYAKLRRRINAGRPFNVPRVKEALQATGIPTINLQRIIMHPESLDMHVSFHNNGRGPGQWVALKQAELFPEPARATGKTAAVAT